MDFEAIAAGSRGSIGGRPGHAYFVKKIWKNGAGGRNRTGTLSPELDFERSQMAYPISIR
jgi:hypothetical protein